MENKKKATEKSCGTLEVNGKCVGTVANIEFEVDMDRCEGFEEFVKMMREAAEKEKVIPKYCPFDNTRGCIRGEVCIIKHVEHENGYNTTECRIRGHRCAAWSDALGRCLRIEPVNQFERRRMNEIARKKVSGCGCCDDITDKTMRM